MALREIRKVGEDVLRKNSRTVEVFDDKLKTLIDDMIDTMYDAQGVGLAAPQVGILKRVVVIDIGEEDKLHVLVNPEIVHSEGSQIDEEGCLSIPGVYEKVDRPNIVKVKAQNANGEEITLDGEGFLARAICHELDHLNGTLFIDKVTK